VAAERDLPVTGALSDAVASGSGRAVGTAERNGHQAGPGHHLGGDVTLLDPPDGEVSVSVPVLAPTAARADGSEGVMLRVVGLRKRFGGITAVDGVDLELPRGELTALIGPNGAGKSTLFGLFTGFITPDEGTVELDGEDILGLSPDRVLRRGMVRSFQDTRLFQAMTVLENVMMAAPQQSGETLRGLFLQPGKVRRDERRAFETAMGYLETVGMVDKANEVVGSLGHGDQKLAAIARVLSTEAPVLLLDEPTSGVDPVWVDRVAAVVRQLPTLGRTVCIVEHNLAFLEKLDANCYFLEMGKVRSRGRLSTLMADEELRHAYFGV
jgi:branched-chain amino acid transport system permease protein